MRGVGAPRGPRELPEVAGPLTGYFRADAAAWEAEVWRRDSVPWDLVLSAELPEDDALDELDGDDVEEETELQVHKVVEELAGDLFKGQTDAPERLPEQLAA